MKKRLVSKICILLAVMLFLSGYSSAVGYAKEYSGSSVVSNNIHDHVYTEHAKVSNSYLTVNSDNTITRVENFGDIILIETYSSSFSLLAQGTINYELERFGGFYSAGNYYYVLFGRDNYEQKDDKEVVRVVQYDKNWNRLKSASIYGAGTVQAFYGCNTDFSEIDDRLYIRMGHLTYKKDDKNPSRQGVMTISLTQSDMAVKDVQFTVEGVKKGSLENVAATYIDASNGVLTAVDHSISENCIVASAYANSSREDHFQSDCIQARALGKSFAIMDSVPDYTVGGYEVSSQYFLIAANTEPSDDSTIAKNIVIIAIPKHQYNTENVELSFLTGFAVGDGMSAETPYIIKAGDNRFCVLWEQRNGYSDTEKVYYAYIDGQGHRLGEINCIDGCLSDCKPVVFNDKIVWYTTNGAVTRLYVVDPSEKPVNGNSGQTQAVASDAVYNGVDYSKVYDFSYYCSRYPDIRVLYSNNPAGALAHFVNNGMKEGRMASPAFNYDVYRKNYPELVSEYGDNKPAYYYHYMTVGYYNSYNARSYK